MKSEARNALALTLWLDAKPHLRESK
jgi:hypothetical protein